MLKILGVGLSRTGTRSLAAALHQLGYKTIHWAPERLRDTVDGRTIYPEVHKYDDVDAVVDIPAAYFWREIGHAYKNLKYILTVRDRESWLASMSKHYNRVKGIDPNLQALVYGSTTITPWLYWQRYCDHTNLLMRSLRPEQLLVLNLFQGGGWPELCGFLDRPIPETPFPHIRDEDPLIL